MIVISSGSGINGCYAVKCNDKFIRDFSAAIISLDNLKIVLTYFDTLIVIALFRDIQIIKLHKYVS